jgi:hypothetical protein
MLRRPSGDGRKRPESLGCLFILIAGAVWSIALARFLESPWAGWRLGFALALLLPALAALFSPGRGRLIVSVVVLTFAVLLGASAVPVLWSKVNPRPSTATLADLDEAILDLRGRIGQAGEYVATLRDDRADLRDRVRRLNYESFDELASDPSALALVEEWSEVDAMLMRTERWLAEARDTLERTESARRRLRRIEEGEAVTGVEADEEELARILAEARAERSPSGPATVEEYAARERLRELFEAEFGG